MAIHTHFFLQLWQITSILTIVFKLYCNSDKIFCRIFSLGPAKRSTRDRRAESQYSTLEGHSLNSSYTSIHKNCRRLSLLAILFCCASLVHASPQNGDAIAPQQPNTISGLTITHNRPYEWRYDSLNIIYAQGYSYPAPGFFSQLTGDTVHLSWKYQGGSTVPYTTVLAYSLDSTRTWKSLTALSDTTIRTYDWILPNQPTTGFYSFFRISLVSGSDTIIKATTDFPVVLASYPPSLSLKWRQDCPAHTYSYYGPESYMSLTVGSLMSIETNKGTALILGPGNSGNPLLRMIDHNGIAFDTSLSLSGSYYLPSSYSFTFTETDKDSFPQIATIDINAEESIQTADCDGDGKMEYVWGGQNAISIGSLENSGTISNTFVSAGYNADHCAIADLDHDGQKELIFTDQKNNDVIVASVQGAVKKPFPATVVDALLPWTMAQQLDSSSAWTILAASSHHLYAFDEDATVRKGFPVYIEESISTRCPVLADINGDGRLEIIFLASTPSNPTSAEYNSFQAPLTKIYVISDDGKILPHWPISVNLNYGYFGKDICVDCSSYSYYAIQPFHGAFSSPLIASIDGDLTPEIILTSNNGFLYIFNSDGSMRPGYPVFIGCGLAETGVVGDFDKDGSLNFLIHSYADPNSDPRLLCLDFGPGSYNPKCIPWPMHLQNPQRTGIAPRPGTGSTIAGGINSPAQHIPSEFGLLQNYPNPFNPSTLIPYQMKESGRVRIVVYDMLGRLAATLVNQEQSAGLHTARFDASHLSSGIYLYRMQTGNSSFVKRMAVQK